MKLRSEMPLIIHTDGEYFCLPAEGIQEVEIEIYTAVEAVLSKLQPSHPDGITQRLVDAAVHLALVPWERKQTLERALHASMDELPYPIRRDSEYAGLRQAAWEAAGERHPTNRKLQRKLSCRSFGYCRLVLGEENLSGLRIQRWRHSN